MLKSRIFTLGATFLCLLGVAGSLQARPGESQTNLEHRLLRDRTAVKIPTRSVEERIYNRSVPYRNLYDYFPEGVEHVVYFKPAEDEKASQTDLDEKGFPDGWELHVVYWKGRSVFECYRRNGSGLSRYEMEGILMLNKDDSFWARVGNDDAEESAIGYQYERKDGKVRALRKGNSLILFIPEFDQQVLLAKKEADSEEDAEAKESAPDSLKGF